MNERLISKHILGGKSDVYLRDNQFDIDIFNALVEQKEYEYVKFNKDPSVIVDAGANIGIASILFAIKFPKARIYAIEPATDNFELLKMNVSAYSSIVPVKCALMGEDGVGDIRNVGGSTLGYQVARGEGNGTVKCISVETFCKEFNIEKIDLLKIDVEGAENDIFSKKIGWLSNVRVLIIELHDRFVKGCNKNVFAATDGCFG